jgi:DNA-binding MarR family transcriptional regulator
MATRTESGERLAAEVGEKLFRLGTLSKRRMRAGLEAAGLTMPQAFALRALVLSTRRVSASDLARDCDMLASTVTGVVDRLEQHGLVTRERDERDRRVVWLRATPAGEALYARLPKLSEQMGRAVEVLEDDELERLSALLDRVLSGMEEGRR